MCGIFAFIDDEKTQDIKTISEQSNKIAHRGPDDHQTNIVNSVKNVDTIFSFHRLKINGLDDISNQPLYHPNNNKLALICNGEIFNFEKLRDEHKFDYKSNSDCEIILHLYERFGIEKTLEMINAEFAFLLLDARDPQNPLLFVARDPNGLRPLFIGYSKDGKVTGFCSELKGIHMLCHDIEQFPGGHWLELSCASTSDRKVKQTDFKSYYNFSQNFGVNFSKSQEITQTELSTVRSLLVDATTQRLMSDREVGLFISGGLDSSAVASIACRHSKKQLYSFAIGLEDTVSSDLINAKKVADFLGTKHHEVRYTIKEGLDAISNVIYHLESYDPTTVRASTPMYLLSKWITKNTPVRVILTGEAPDELLGGYLYFFGAPSLEAFQKETEDRVKKLPVYDVLRCDRAPAAASLEVRAPYLDKAFLNYCINLHPMLKHPKYNKNIEKYILRKALDDEKQPYLPKDILWRPKEAFSDGVGYAWKDALIKYCEEKVSDEMFAKREQIYPFNTPLTKEGFYYRQVFESFFPGREKLIPEPWMPKWVDPSIKDPSATVLKIHADRVKTTQS